jgi:hypothetical protein
MKAGLVPGMSILWHTCANSYTVADGSFTVKGAFNDYSD